MSPDIPQIGQLDDAAIANRLLAVLRQRLNEPGLGFVEPPARITGGFETLTYAFSLSSPSGKLASQFTSPLILRLFSKAGAGDQAGREQAIQNALAGLGYPVPRVLAQFDTGIEGRPFNIMERIDGHPMMDDLEMSEISVTKHMTWLAKVQARLHKVPAGPVIEAVEAAGYPRDRFTVSGRLRFMNRYFEDDVLDGLRPVHEWLVSNLPEERERPTVCHGDFHPANIMVMDGKVTGVIDWPAASFADPEMDVASTLTLIKVGAGEIAPETRPLLDAAANLYLNAYQNESPIDPEKVNYYEALRCFRAFTRATTQHTPGIRPDLLPRDNYPWNGEYGMRTAKARVDEVTGLDLPLPSNFDS